MSNSAASDVDLARLGLRIDGVKQPSPATARQVRPWHCMQRGRHLLRSPTARSANADAPSTLKWPNLQPAWLVDFSPGVDTRWRSVGRHCSSPLWGATSPPGRPEFTDRRVLPVRT